MEQLVFVGIIVAFSILEALARKNRAQQRQDGGGLPKPEDLRPPRPAPAPRPAARPRASSVPRSYDEDASFDEVVKDDERGPRPRQGDVEPARTASEREPASSEGLIPDEVWQEIEALARGGSLPVPKPPAQPRPRGAARPRTAGRSPAPGGPSGPKRPTARERAAAPARVAEVAPSAEGAHDQPVYVSRTVHGTEIRDRATAHAPRGAARGSAVSGAVLALMKGSRTAARDAVILQEILGPPAGLRD